MKNTTMLVVLVMALAASVVCASTSYINEARVSVSVTQVTTDVRYTRMIGDFGLNAQQVYACGGEVTNLPEGARGKCRWGLNNDIVYEWAYVSAQESTEMTGVLFRLGKDAQGNEVIVHCQRGSQGNAIVFYGILPCKNERVIVEKTEVVHEQPIIQQVQVPAPAPTPNYGCESLPPAPAPPPCPEPPRTVVVERVIERTKIVAGMRCGAPYQDLRPAQSQTLVIPPSPGIIGAIAPMFYPTAKTYISAAASATGGAGGAGGAGGSACVGPITNNLENINNIANSATNNTAVSVNQAQAQD